MAKKIAKPKVEDNKPVVDVVEASIVKDFGEGILIDASAILSRKVQVISVSPALDIGLSGGVPEGSWVVFTGPEKCGKTTTALHFAANCQMEENGGRMIYYLDVEGRFKQMNLLGIPHMQLDKLKVIQSKQGKILSAEDWLSIAEKIVNNKPGSVLIVDSYSALATDAELNGELVDQQRADAQKLLAKFIRRIGTTVSCNNIIMIGITHIMSNPGARPGQASKVEKSAASLKYQGDVKLKCDFVEPWKDGEKQIGQVVHWKVMWSALGPPGMEVESYIRYGKGVDVLAELVILGSEVNLFVPSGSWLSCEIDGEIHKAQGLAKMVAYLKDKPELVAKIRTRLMEILT